MNKKGVFFLLPPEKYVYISALIAQVSKWKHSQAPDPSLHFFSTRSLALSFSSQRSVALSGETFPLRSHDLTAAPTLGELSFGKYGLPAQKGRSWAMWEDVDPVLTGHLPGGRGGMAVIGHACCSPQSEGAEAEEKAWRSQVVKPQQNKNSPLLFCVWEKII